jgi:hypothetical protein
MGRYLLQTDAKDLDIEYMLVKNKIEHNKFLFDYLDLDTESMLKEAKEGDIPIGDINYVTKFIQKVYNIEKENPIEIPKYLRTEGFLKRSYKILTYDQLVQLSGKVFIKDVSELKKFSSIVNTDYENIADFFETKNKNDYSLVLDKTHLFQVSSIYDVESEYRVYVIDNDIVAIENYNGDCTVLPDVDLIEKAVQMIMVHERYLKSYTIDVMVGRRGTALAEIHNFASVGLYSNLWGLNLVYAYRDGIDYLIHDNKPIEI